MPTSTARTRTDLYIHQVEVTSNWDKKVSVKWFGLNLDQCLHERMGREVEELRTEISQNKDEQRNGAEAQGQEGFQESFFFFKDGKYFGMLNAIENKLMARGEKHLAEERDNCRSKVLEQLRGLD